MFYIYKFLIYFLNDIKIKKFNFRIFPPLIPIICLINSSDFYKVFHYCPPENLKLKSLIMILSRLGVFRAIPNCFKC